MAELSKKTIQLGAIAPDFTVDTTQGKISFHQWIGDSWCILFSHPKDFTPVCTTELGSAARLSGDFSKRGVKLIALSVGSVASHKEWIPDINKTQGAHLSFPIIGDENHIVSELYHMIHPLASDTATVRSVFIIDPKKTIRLILTYPASTGRNFQEILRVVDSLQLTDKHKVATPADWIKGQECAILPSVTDPEEIKKLFPQGFRQVTSYLRFNTRSFGLAKDKVVIHMGWHKALDFFRHSLCVEKRGLLLTSLLILSFPLAATAEIPACYKDLELNFFKVNLLNEALSLHAVSQSNWSLINMELQRNIKRVPEIVRQRAKGMDPNPFEIPFQSHAAAELLRQVLLEVFSETLAIFHITNQSNIEEMFQYIRERQSQRLVACFGEERSRSTIKCKKSCACVMSHLSKYA